MSTMRTAQRGTCLTFSLWSCWFFLTALMIFLLFFWHEHHARQMAVGMCWLAVTATEIVFGWHWNFDEMRWSVNKDIPDDRPDAASSVYPQV